MLSQLFLYPPTRGPPCEPSRRKAVRDEEGSGPVGAALDRAKSVGRTPLPSPLLVPQPPFPDVWGVDFEAPQPVAFVLSGVKVTL